MAFRESNTAVAMEKRKKMRQLNKKYLIGLAIASVCLLGGLIFYFSKIADDRCARPHVTAVDHCDGYWEKAFNN